MIKDFELIPSVVAAAGSKMDDGELLFTFPGVLEAIRAGTTQQIAVLGFELMQVYPDGLFTRKLSGYDKQMEKAPTRIEDWPDYVRLNNNLAEEFVRLNPTGDDEVYVLTTSSWREMGKIEELRQQWNEESKRRGRTGNQS